MRLVHLSFGITLLLSAPLLAHEGHNEEGPKPIVMPDQTVVQETASEAVELVLKHPAFEPGRTILSRVFLSTADENKPIANAKVEFEFADLDGLKIKFTPEKDHPGVYSANVTLAKSGTFDATVSVSGKDVSDLLTLSGIEAKSVSTGGTQSWSTYIYLGAGLALLFIVAGIVVIVVRRRKHV